MGLVLSCGRCLVHIPKIPRAGRDCKRGFLLRDPGALFYDAGGKGADKVICKRESTDIYRNRYSSILMTGRSREVL